MGSEILYFLLILFVYKYTRVNDNMGSEKNTSTQGSMIIDGFGKKTPLPKGQ